MLRESKLKTFVWYASVGLLVLLAISVTLFRLYFSSVAEYREQLQEMAGDYLGLPVRISGMDARLAGISPTLILSDVSLLEEGGEQLLTQFSSISIALDPVASLGSLMPIIELTVSGARLEIMRKGDGSFGVQGVKLPSQVADADKGVAAAPADGGEALGSWFLSQSRLAVRDSQITLHNEKSGERFSFNNVELELRNSGGRHRLNGFVYLPEAIGKELRVAVDIEGNPLEGKEWEGNAYINMAQLHPQQWLSELSWEGGEVRGGMLSAEIWSHWKRGQLDSARAQVDATDLQLADGKMANTFQRVSTDARLLMAEDGWSLDVGELLVQQTNLATEPTRLRLTRQGESFHLQAESVQLKGLAALLAYAPQLKTSTKSMIQQLSPVGVVERVSITRGTDQKLALQGAVKGLSLMPWKGVPGVEGLDARFRFNGDDGAIRLNASDTVLTFPKLFRESLLLQQLNGELKVQREAKGWRLQTDSLVAANQDISVQVGLEMLLSEGASPWLSLQGRFRDGDASTVSRYLPAKIMKEKSLQWLDAAFIGGRVVQGRVQFHGQTNHFPFKEKRGRFEVLFDAEAVQLHYRDGWPDLHQLVGEVHFDGPGMWINASNASLFDAQVRNTTVSIENFSAARLLVNGEVDFPVSDGLRFLRESPLLQGGVSMQENLQATGNAGLALQLAIPLSETVAESMPLSVNGEVSFADNQLTISEGLILTGINGGLTFSEKSFSANQISAELFGKPVAIAMVDGGDKTEPVFVVARGHSDIAVLREKLKLPLLEHLKGSADWQARITIPRAGEVGAVLQINSTLEGVSSSFPAPLAKAPDEVREMELRLYLSGPRRGEKHLRLNKLLGLAWEQDAGGALNRAQLRMGAGEPLKLPQGKSLEVVGESGRFYFEPWRALLRDQFKSNRIESVSLPIVIKMEQLHLLSDPSLTKTTDISFKETPEISVKVDQFSYDDMRLGKVKVKLIPNNNGLAIRGIHLESDVFKLIGNGRWTTGNKTSFDLKLDSANLEKMLKHFGFASVIKNGVSKVSGKLWWTGEPGSLSLETLNAKIHVVIEKGTIVDVEPGAGRMLGILSLPALPRRLFLDFSDVFKKGLEFNEIKGDIEVKEGNAYTSNLYLESPPANILVNGRTGLVAQDFDQDIYVVPNVSDTVSVASALAWGPQVAAMVALFQEVFKSDIKAATMTRYRITGNWVNPNIERIEEAIKKEPATPFYE